MTTEGVYIKYKHYICKMEKEFIPYELALRMKQLHFDEPCFGYYETVDKNLVINFNNFPLSEEQQKRAGLYLINNSNSSIPQWAVSAPTFSQAFRWFRKEYPDLDFGVAKIHNGTNNYHYHINLEWVFFEGIYEEAELQCLTKLIEGVEK
jgi:hypothetical protein